MKRSEINKIISDTMIWLNEVSMMNGDNIDNRFYENKRDLQQ